MALPIHCWPADERRAYFRRAYNRWLLRPGNLEKRRQSDIIRRKRKAS